MAADYKGVPEWAEVFRVAQTKAYEELQPATTDSIQAELAFVASSQDLKTPGRKGRTSARDSDENLSSSPFLSDHDLTQRDKWRENALLPKGLAEHVKKLGDAMNFVMSMAEAQEHKEEDFYTDVVEDLAKIKAWQSMTDARIGQTLPILGREFPNLWSALDYSVRQKEEAMTSSIAKLQQEMLEATKREEQIKKQTKDWLSDVVQSFENVKAHFGDMAAELKTLKIAQARQSSVGSGSVADGPRIRNGVLFPSAKSTNGRNAGDSDPGEPLGDETLKIVIELRKQITILIHVI
jgi:hypothetical protein